MQEHTRIPEEFASTLERLVDATEELELLPLVQPARARTDAVRRRSISELHVRLGERHDEVESNSEAERRPGLSPFSPGEHTLESGKVVIALDTFVTVEPGDFLSRLGGHGRLGREGRASVHDGRTDVRKGAR